jgi:hypothetical protein
MPCSVDLVARRTYLSDIVRGRRGVDSAAIVIDGLVTDGLV